jgi:3-oxoacyl-[acyl-carrier-protein] synthase-3
MITLANMIELGQVKRGIVVAGETAEDLVESTISQLLEDTSITRKTIKPMFASFTIGSGAVAVVMEARDMTDTGHYLRGGMIRANTSQCHLCQGGSMGEQGVLMATDSETLLVQGVETALLCWQDFLQEFSAVKDDFQQFFCHQVGRAHAALLFEKLGLDQNKNFETLGFLGNVGSVSAPITFAIGVEQGALQPGESGAILGIGSGINACMLRIDW